MIKKFRYEFEIVGLILLLLSFGSECFSQRMEYHRTEGLMLELHEKVDRLWADEYMELTRSDENKTTSSFYMDYNATNESWKYVGSQLNNDFESVVSQSEISGQIRMVLYVLGSILVILSKIRYRDES